MGMFSWLTERGKKTQVVNPEPPVIPIGDVPPILSRDVYRFNAFEQMLGVQGGRSARYDDLEAMDTGDIAALLDSVCHACLTFDQNDSDGTEMDRPVSFKVQALKSRNHRNAIDQVLRQTQLKDKLWYYLRDGIKYGDLFLELLVDKKLGLVGLQSYYPRSISVKTDNHNRLLVGADPDNAGQQFPYQQLTASNSVGASWSPADMIHWRWQPSDYYPYSIKGLLDDMRADWKKLSTMELAMVVARIVRAYPRNVHYVDTTGMGDQDAQRALGDYMRKVSFSLRRQQNQALNNGAGQPTAPDEELFVTTGYLKDPEGKLVPRLNKVDTIDPNAAGVSKITDVEYQRRKMFSRVPAEIIGIQSRNPKAINAQDVAFGRLIRYAQSRAEDLVRDVIDAGLILEGYDLGEVPYDVYWPRNTVGTNWLHADAQFRGSMSFMNWVGMGLSRREALKRNWGMTDDEVDKTLSDWKKEMADLGPLDQGTPAAKATAGNNSDALGPDADTDDIVELLNAEEDEAA